MNHWMWAVSLAGILSTAVVYGTDMFFLTVGRPALRSASTSAGTEVMGFLHMYADARMPSWGLSAILSNLLLAIFSGSGQRWFYLASLSMLILFVTIYNLLSKPINRLQTDLLALRSGTPPDVFLGSVTRDCEAVRANTRIVASRPRTIDAFRALVERGGWKLNQVVKRPFSYHVRLVWA
jgi:hypothetical protein